MIGLTTGGDVDLGVSQDVCNHRGPMVFQFEVPQHLQTFFELADVTGSDDESWSLHTDPDNTSAESQASTVSCQSDVDSGGGEREEAPNNREDGSCPVASYMSGQAALRRIHQNVAEYIEEEMAKLDATSGEQALWFPAITDAVAIKSSLERQLKQLHCLDEQEANRAWTTTSWCHERLVIKKFGTTWKLGDLQLRLSTTSWSMSRRQCSS